MGQPLILNFIAVVLLFISQINISRSDKSEDKLKDGEFEDRIKRILPKTRATDSRGCPAQSETASLTVGRYGNILLQDSNLLEHLAHFNRERIPERANHAKGAGAFGYFKVTHDITQYTSANLFEHIGKITNILVRFSITIGQSGGSDVALDGRGFAIKFYTEDGNWDLVGNNLPVFQVREPILFPLSLHSRKRDPSTHMFNPNAKWDFDSLRPETTFHTIMQHSGLGSPDGYRHMDGFGVHTFKLVNSDGKQVYCKFHLRTNQGIKNLTTDEAAKIAGTNLDYAVGDLYNAITNKNYPSWKFAIQVMTFEQAAKYRWNPFDITKLWLETDFPLIPVGQLVLNRNPVDFLHKLNKLHFKSILYQELKQVLIECYIVEYLHTPMHTGIDWVQMLIKF